MRFFYACSHLLSKVWNGEVSDTTEDAIRINACSQKNKKANQLSDLL